MPTYAELVAQHLADAKLHQKSWKTTEMYLRRHVVPWRDTMRIADIDTRPVAQWLASKRDEGFSPATVEKIRVTLGRSFELGAKWGIQGAERSPTRGVPRKPLNNARERFLTAEEAARLREAAASSRNPLLRPDQPLRPVRPPFVGSSPRGGRGQFCCRRFRKLPLFQDVSEPSPISRSSVEPPSAGRAAIVAAWNQPDRPAVRGRCSP